MSYYLGCSYELDCVKAPITDRCREFCLERILRYATPEEKRLILGYSDQVASAIYRAYNNHTIENFQDLALYINKEQQEEILNKFQKISQYQLDYFKLSREKRNAIINAIKNLGLDLNNDLA